MFPFFTTVKTNTWFLVGRTSSFPDIPEPSADAGRIFQVSEESGNRGGVSADEVPVISGSEFDETETAALKDQVLVFQYKGAFHAVDHKCPHMSFPLSHGHMFDIEDFGIVLSAGLTCPKHGWSFDVFTGLGDRGTYKLKVWEVELRDVAGDVTEDKEVWVRRKPRIG